MQTTHSVIVSPVDSAKQAHHVDGLRSPLWLGRKPLIGILLTLLGAVVFGTLALGIQTHNPLLLQTDAQIAENLHTTALHTAPLILGIAIFGYYAGQEVIVVIGAALVLYFLLKHYWTELWMVLIAWGGEAVIWLGVSSYFNRQRPVFATPAWHQMTVPGFPSGHVFGAVLCYGLLAYLLLPKFSTRFWKTVVIIGALAIILYIGISRLFIGDHYPSDVLAGYGLGTAWGSFVYTLVESIALRRRHMQPS